MYRVGLQVCGGWSMRWQKKVEQYIYIQGFTLRITASILLRVVIKALFINYLRIRQLNHRSCIARYLPLGVDITHDYKEEYEVFIEYKYILFQNIYKK